MWVIRDIFRPATPGCTDGLQVVPSHGGSRGFHLIALLGRCGTRIDCQRRWRGTQRECCQRCEASFGVRRQGRVCRRLVSTMPTVRIVPTAHIVRTMRIVIAEHPRPESDGGGAAAHVGSTRALPRAEGRRSSRSTSPSVLFQARLLFPPPHHIFSLFWVRARDTDV